VILSILSLGFVCGSMDYENSLLEGGFGSIA
jgi:hypothetical protein